MADFQKACTKLIIAEGGYKLVNVQGDKGGMTYAGITRRSFPYWGGWSMIDNGETPPTSLVNEFYLETFWTPLLCEKIIEDSVAYSVFEFAVNAGLKTATKLAQIVAGASPDGRMGNKTLAAINEMDSSLFLALFALAKVARYRDIVQRDRTQMKFLLGWINRALKEVKIG